MAQAVTYTKVTDLQKAYKRSTTKLYRIYAKRVPEWEFLDDIPDEDIIPSGRQNLIPVDIQRGVGAHQADDGGYESQTTTPALAEGAFVYNHTNSRFAISLRAQAFDKAARGNFIIRQIKYQSIKCVEAAMRKKAYMYYGLSTGVLCQTSTAATQASGVYTLLNPFGQSALNAASTAAAYMANMFAIGEGVALIRASALVTNAIGLVTAVSTANGTITVTWGGSVTSVANDFVVYANAVTDATISATDFNKWNTGLLDCAVTDTVMSLSTATDSAAWASALYDTNGGSFGFLKIKKIRQALENQGDGVLKRIVWSQGVENDVQARERSALMWLDSGKMNIDANVTSKGVSFDSTRFTPPSCAFGVGADAFGKSVLTDKVSEDESIEFASLYKAEDRSALKGGIDIIDAFIVRSRARTTCHVGLTEQ